MGLRLRALLCIVCVTVGSFDVLNHMALIVAVFHDEIRVAIPGIVACLKDSQWGVREAAIYGLSNVAAHCMCYYLFPFDIVNHIHSWIAWRVSSEDIGIH